MWKGGVGSGLEISLRDTGAATVTMAFMRSGIGVMVAAACALAVCESKRGPDIDQATFNQLMKQELTRKTPNGLTEGETTALIKDRKKRAAGLLAAHGLSSDGTIGSIKEVDHLIDVAPAASRAAVDDLGAYLGEAIRSFAGGTWTAKIDGGRLELELELPDGAHVRPLERVRKRIADGPSESLYAYAGSLAGRPSRSPAERRAGGEKR